MQASPDIHAGQPGTGTTGGHPASGPRPWGLSRLAPFPNHGDGSCPPYRVILDPEIQTGVRIDIITNQPIEVKHGSNVEKPTATKPQTSDGNGGNPPNGGSDSTTDWVSD
ncbi:putative ATP-grasp-modified RiPP [Nonomuraea purpurea]|uniref:ATP-grasp-modified RiPP n=1 Tax=Nonomuraea purpurea TaxID=1849276 RepID=A0ABV8GQ48_9ACTN